MTTQDPTGQQRDWVSNRAISWVLDDAPCPAELLPVLTAIARRCDESGRGSRQRTAVIAEKAGKSKKQAQRDIVRLRDMGLLLPGDESLVAHLPEYERPAVYDLPLHVKGPKPIKESRNPTGGKRADQPATPSHARDPLPSKGGPPIHAPDPLPCKGAPPSLGREPEQTMNKPENNPSLSPREPAASAPAVAEPERERDDQPSAQPLTPIQAILAAHGATGANAEHVQAYADALPGGPKGPGWYHTCAANGSLPGHIVAALTPPAVDPVQHHPDAHPFEPDLIGRSCKRCLMPEANARHRLPTAA